MGKRKKTDSIKNRWLSFLIEHFSDFPQKNMNHSAGHFLVHQSKQLQRQLQLRAENASYPYHYDFYKTTKSF